VTLAALAVRGLPELKPGDDIAALLVAAATAPGGPRLADGDVVVVTSKAVSKAEGRLVRGRERDEVIDEQTEQVVATWDGPNGRTVIARTRQGLVMAAAGVDASNVEQGTLVLLPEDPDASARRIRAVIRDLAGVNVGVLVSDTMGRAWRLGQTDMAIGAAGMAVLDDLRGAADDHGNRLDATVRALADEIAGVADLVAGKTSGVPVVVVRGLDVVLPAEIDGPGASALVRPIHEDRFRLGVTEAVRQAIRSRRTVREYSDEVVPREAILSAVQAAVTAPAPHHTAPWRFVLIETFEARQRLLTAMRERWVADLRADGLDEEVIGRRVARGDILWRAPLLVVPCLVTDGSHVYPDVRRSEAERTMFTLSMGAAIQNLLVTLSAEGLAAAWVGATLFCPEPVLRHLNLPGTWYPMGIVAVGYPVRPPPSRNRVSSEGFISER